MAAPMTITALRRGIHCDASGYGSWPGLAARRPGAAGPVRPAGCGSLRRWAAHGREPGRVAGRRGAHVGDRGRVPEPCPRGRSALPGRLGSADHCGDGVRVPVRDRGRAGGVPGRARRRELGHRTHRVRDGDAGQAGRPEPLDANAAGRRTLRCRITGRTKTGYAAPATPHPDPQATTRTTTGSTTTPDP